MSVIDFSRHLQDFGDDTFMAAYTGDFCCDFKRDFAKLYWRFRGDLNRQ